MNIQFRAKTSAELSDIPSTNGIYIFRSRNEPIYIGKSVNIKARLISHIENAKKDPKEAAIIEGADSIDFIITDSEFKALILESQLIQQYLPKYNVRWRDDKSYLYIKATVKDPYPKFFITRREDDKKAVYYGPFPSVIVATNILREIRKVFPFCSQKRITNRTCFYAKIGMCNPCPNAIEQIEDIAEKRLKKKEYRKNCTNILKILDGKIDPVVDQLYKEINTLIKEEKYEEAIPFRNRLYRLEHVVLRRKFGSNPDEFNVSETRLTALLSMLKPHFPSLETLNRIECYDMSTFQFKESTASMVVFSAGLSDKKEYKRFKIKNQSAESDFEMIDEVLRRRLRNDWDLPDLLVIDGGKPQVRAALKVLQEMSISIPLIGIAKRPDRIVIGKEPPLILRPPLHNQGFRLIQSLRDESHRFAKKYHVLLRNKKLML